MDNRLAFANETLLELLAASGLDAARLWQGSFVAGEAELWGKINEATIVERSGGGSSAGAAFMASVQVELYTDRNKSYTVVDSAVGIASTPEAALRAAVTRYLDGTLRAFRALTDPAASPPDQPPTMLQTLPMESEPPVLWKCFYGGWLTTGPAETDLRNALVLNSPLLPLKDEILVGLSERTARTHWLKILAIRRQDGRVIPECSFDNVPFAAGAEKLCLFDGWPQAAAQTMQSFRQFVVFQPQGQIVRTAPASPASAVPQKAENTAADSGKSKTVTLRSVGS